MDAAGCRVGAVAVRDGRIAAVGDEADIRALVGPGTEVVDLEGRMLLPGFQDAHVHPVTGGLDLLRCNLHELESASAVGEAVAGYAARHPGQPWILGGGWAMDWFPGGTPGAASLDQVVPDRPVFLRNRDGHGAWVNSRALEMAGIDTATPDPPDGRIERHSDGSPQGTLHEGAMHLVARLIPAVSVSDWERGLAEGQAYLLSLGVTAWQDAWVEAEHQAAYLALEGRGALRASVVGALWWDRSRGEEQVDELLDLRRGTGDRYRPTTVKLMLDGVCENFTASLLEPYLDRDGRSTANTGIDFIDPGALPRYVTRLDAEGFQCHFHAIGDRAVRRALDAVEAARAANGRSDGRHHIAHLQVIHPDDIPRFRRLGVVANAQPYWACEEGYQTELTIPFLGPERVALQYPFGSLRRAGARLAMGSDWSVSTPNPLLEIEVAVNRVAPYDREHRPFLPEERLDLADALAAFTIGSAYVNHLDGQSGSIEVGKDADLVVVDRDLFADGPIGDACIDLTLIGGEAAFERS
ncbi:MAG: amidohydrolase [Acidimicrobiia bacterium]